MKEPTAKEPQNELLKPKVKPGFVVNVGCWAVRQQAASKENFLGGAAQCGWSLVPFFLGGSQLYEILDQTPWAELLARAASWLGSQ